MVKIKTVDGWNLPAIGVTMKNEDDVENIFCKICKEYYTEDEDGKTALDKLVGILLPEGFPLRTIKQCVFSFSQFTRSTL